jgi:hypothetical protein
MVQYPRWSASPDWSATLSVTAPRGLINITATEPVIDKLEPPLDGSYVPRLGGGDFFKRALSIYLDSGVARSSGGLITRPA